MAPRRTRIRRRIRRRPRVHVNPVKRYVSTRRTMKWGRIANDVRYLKGLINTEIKYLDHNYQSADEYYDIVASNTAAVPAIETVPPTPGYLHLVIPYMGIGDDFNERTGRSVRLKSLQLKGRVALNMPTGTNNLLSVGQFRIMVIVDHQAQMGEVTDPTNILYSLDVNGDFSLESRVNRQRNKRYTILMQRKYKMTQQYNPVVDINMFKRINDKIKFEGVNAADFMDKCFHVIGFVSGGYPIAGTLDTFTRLNGQFNTRVTYIDN